MTPISDNQESQLVRSYLELRQAVGWLGIALPIVLPLGVLLVGSAEVFQPSISDYIDTIMRGVFVGILFAIGVFLFTYRGHERDDRMRAFEPADNVAGNLACVFALGVALFPTSGPTSIVRTFHFVSATALFVTLAYFSLRLFTKTSEYPITNPKKLARNRVYRICGWFMLACIGLIAFYGWFLSDTGISEVNPVFWLETLALWAFGVSWFVKGDGYRPLRDR